MPGKPKRREPRAPRGPRARRDRLQVWRGVLLVAAGGGGLAGLGVSWSARSGDVLVTGLFAGALVALLALAVVAVRRVRRLLAEGEGGARG